MSRIRIKNFGPIKEGFLENDGWMDIKKITVLIGSQGSGKSTIAKAFSTLSWMEKAIYREEIVPETFNFVKFIDFFDYHNLREYFSNDTIIEYEGEAYAIKYNRKEKYPIFRKKMKSKYLVPKIMYVPAERNFLSVIQDAFDVKGLPSPLFTFAEEFRKAQFKLAGKTLSLPLKNYSYEFDAGSGNSYVKGLDHRINLLNSASGFQSLIPLYVVSRHLTNLVLKKNVAPSDNMSVNKAMKINEEITRISLDSKRNYKEKMLLIKLIQRRYLNKCFINIVEEPEQNLYPSSQKLILYDLLGYQRRVSLNNKIF
ncbi:MAG: AAA family ATPase [Bacteroidales bacterium]|nr:AAA family ATPase [Bacteroidales bacterium]